MVNNSTNINKRNNHLKPLNTKKTWHMALEIKILALDRHNNVAGLNCLIGYQPYPTDNWISIYNTDKF
jgi:hypothetical protein